jgi:hypothetical protein
VKELKRRPYALRNCVICLLLIAIPLFLLPYLMLLLCSSYIAASIFPSQKFAATELYTNLGEGIEKNIYTA